MHGRMKSIRAFQNTDLHIFFVQPGKLGGDDDVIGRLSNVYSRRPGATGKSGFGKITAEEIIKKAIHFFPHIQHVPRRTPTNE